MCGIIGVTGRADASAVIVAGLRRLEYRGYDSAGVVTLNGAMEIVKKAGKLDNLVRALAKHPVSGSTGVGHTR